MMKKNKNHFVLEQLKDDGKGSGLWQQCKHCLANFQTAHMRMDCLCDACRTQPAPHTPEELAIIDEEAVLTYAYERKLAAEEAACNEMLDHEEGIRTDDLPQHLEDEGLLEWNKLLQSTSSVPEMGLSSQRIGLTLSVQIDSENNTVLLASDNAQILLSVQEQEQLEQVLYERRCARYEALHRSFYSKYI
jgi:hypothetical protein